jgi:hypothetical protein
MTITDDDIVREMENLTLDDKWALLPFANNLTALDKHVLSCSELIPYLRSLAQGATAAALSGRKQRSQ